MNSLIIFVAGILTITCIAPILWHFWVYQGSGNPNFFYALTLVYAAMQILLINDLVRAMLKFDLYKQHPALELSLNKDESQEKYKLLFR